VSPKGPMLKYFGQEHLRYTQLSTNVHGREPILCDLEALASLAPFARYRLRSTPSSPSSYDPTHRAGGRATNGAKGGDGRTKELRTTVNAGGSGGGGQKWQMDTDRGAMAQQAVDLNPTLVIIYDPVHCG
jgi:hypothetical protein